MFTASPLSRYQELIAEEALRSDDHQCSVVERLQKLHSDLRSYTPPPIPTEAPTQSFVCLLTSIWSDSHLPRSALATITTIKRTNRASREPPERSIPIWRCRDRQINVDGPPLRNATAERQTKKSSALSRIYDRCPQATTCLQDRPSA